jgi:hypothetical protein
MRFTLGKMFLAVAMLALACAGLAYRTTLWASGIFALTIAMFIYAGISSRCGSERERLVSFAFALTLGTYLFGSFFFGELGWLPSTFVIAILGIRSGVIPDDGRTFNNVEELLRFIRTTPLTFEAHVLFIVGHCVFSWIFALLAAWFAGWMYDRRERGMKEADR